VDFSCKNDVSREAHSYRHHFDDSPDQEYQMSNFGFRLFDTSGGHMYAITVESGESLVITNLTIENLQGLGAAIKVLHPPCTKSSTVFDLSGGECPNLNQEREGAWNL